jgi:hypothetical protein
MPHVKVEETKLVAGNAAKVYKILAETKHHVKILPEAFVDYKEEADGTISYGIVYGGMRRDFTATIERVEEDKLLREIQLPTQAVTDFVLEEHPDGTLVTIRSEYDTPKTISGWLEAKFAPGFMHKLFDEELTKLARYVLTVQ